MQKSINKFILFLITAAVLVGVDQWSKYEAMTKLGRSDAYPLIKNVLYFGIRRMPERLSEYYRASIFSSL